MAFADIGFGNVVNVDRIVSVVSGEAAPTKSAERIMQKIENPQARYNDDEE